MKEVNIDKGELLTILKENKSKHLANFEKATKGYQEEAVKLLKVALKSARAGEVDLSFTRELDKPSDHSDDYDKAIRMLELSVDSNIKLDEREFDQYVRDNWDWSYSNTMTISKYMK